VTDKKHELVSTLKRIASELGRVPTRDQFLERSGVSRRQLDHIFGGYQILKSAAGMDDAQKSEKKNSRAKEFFLADISEIVRPIESGKALAPAHGVQSRILLIGDTHFPFVSVDALCGLYSFVSRTPGITHIVQMGDLFDCYSFASFPKSMMEFTPRQELELAREMAGKMWAKLQELCPQAECHQILGNHSMRPIKRLLEQSPELEVFFDYQNIGSLRAFSFTKIRASRL
jgi:hypothetical protein